MANSNRFKNASGQHILKIIFQEYAFDDKTYVAYTLKDEDTDYPSLRRLYVETSDLTEFSFAEKYLDGWNHWQKIKACPWFKPLYEEWRQELEAKIESRALQTIITKALNPDDKDAVQCAKFLATRAYKEKTGKRGPRTKQQIKDEANKLFESRSDVADDWKRLMQ